MMFGKPMRLTTREKILAPIVVGGLIAGFLMAANLLRSLGLSQDWSLAIPGVGFGVWSLAWATQVHENPDTGTASKVTRLSLLTIAAAAAAAVVCFSIARLLVGTF